MEEELEIKLQVGGTYYPLKIKRSEEPDAACAWDFHR